MQGIRDNDHQARSVPSGSDQTPGRAAHNVGTNTHANTNTLVLCNAEPFGFGPAASLREVLPHLRQALRNVDHLSLHYVGSGHTLALHKCGPSGWDAVHDVDVYAEGGSQLLSLLCETLRPALFLTVSDATAASAAMGTGVPVVIIDLLLWYWPEIPEPWHRAKQVLAPNFEGVHARVQDEALRNVVVVPPIAPSLTSQDTDLAKVSREGILVNLGGLRNPFIPADDHVAYAHAIDRAAHRAVELRDMTRPGTASLSLRTVAGPEMVQALGRDRASTVDPAGAQALLRRTSLVCMTPGLGNLFEASACAQNVLTLPPATDSQGRQMVLLKRQGLLDWTIDWHELVGGPPIDYWKPQQTVLRDIQTAQQTLLSTPLAQAHLARRVSDAVRDSESSTTFTPLRVLIKRFGNDGARVIAAAVAKIVYDVNNTPMIESSIRDDAA